MSKDIKINYNKLVETVENSQQLISWISSTLDFWKLNSEFPCNLIKDYCDDFYEKIENLLNPTKPF